jgi:hypothetical protein
VQEQVTSPSANAYIVHAVIDASAPVQYVFLQHTVGSLRDQIGVGGATVSITTPDGIVMRADEVRDSTLFSAQNTPKMYVAYRIEPGSYGQVIVAGGTYRLRIRTADGTDITGTTTVPVGEPDVGSVPLETFSRTRDTLRIEWRPQSSVRAYQYSATPTTASGSTASTTSAFADSLIVVPGSGFRVGAQYRIAVVAVDDNFFDYYRRSGDTFTGVSAASRLDGAVGVFGSVSPVRRRNLLVQ